MKNLYIKSLLIVLVLTMLKSMRINQSFSGWNCYNWNDNDKEAGAGSGNMKRDLYVCQSKGPNYKFLSWGSCGDCNCCYK